MRQPGASQEVAGPQSCRHALAAQPSSRLSAGALVSGIRAHAFARLHAIGETARRSAHERSDEWEWLRSLKERDAWMPESKRRAVPKVSRLGTRFFAHPPGHAPAGAKESDLHLYLKSQCLIGARAAGWDALPEQSGKTPNGQEWRADILCRRPGKG